MDGGQDATGHDGFTPNAGGERNNGGLMGKGDGNSHHLKRLVMNSHHLQTTWVLLKLEENTLDPLWNC